MGGFVEAEIDIQNELWAEGKESERAANDVGKMKSKSQIERNKCKKWLDKPLNNNYTTIKITTIQHTHKHTHTERVAK